ncbi:26667_t:CDS:1, partial [Gigaspora margarita]
NRLSQRIINNNGDDINGANDSDDNNDANDDGDYINIRNPIKRRSKGRPKSTRIKSSLEQSSTKIQKTQYKCKLCIQKGYNSKQRKNFNNVEMKK